MAYSIRVMWCSIEFKRMVLINVIYYINCNENEQLSNSGILKFCESNVMCKTHLI